MGALGSMQYGGYGLARALTLWQSALGFHHITRRAPSLQLRQGLACKLAEVVSIVDLS